MRQDSFAILVRILILLFLGLLVRFENPALRRIRRQEGIDAVHRLTAVGFGLGAEDAMSDANLAPGLDRNLSLIRDENRHQETIVVGKESQSLDQVDEELHRNLVAEFPRRLRDMGGVKLARQSGEEMKFFLLDAVHQTSFLIVEDQPMCLLDWT